VTGKPHFFCLPSNSYQENLSGAISRFLAPALVKEAFP